MNKHYTSLELDKILNMLSDTASSTDAKERALEIKPLTDYFEVLELLDKTETATIPALITLGNKPFSFVIQAKYAITGEASANTVQPIMYTSLYTPFVKIATI